MGKDAEEREGYMHGNPSTHYYSCRTGHMGLSCPAPDVRTSQNERVAKWVNEVTLISTKAESVHINEPFTCWIVELYRWQI